MAHSAAAALARFLPRLVHSRLPDATLIFELVPDALPLGSLLDLLRDDNTAIAAACELGKALGTIHRAFERIDAEGDAFEVGVRPMSRGDSGSTSRR